MTMVLVACAEAAVGATLKAYAVSNGKITVKDICLCVDLDDAMFCYPPLK
jgi:hypothetical protein